MHRLAASKDERPSTMLGHKGAIMCMDAQRHAEDGTVLSSSSTLITGSVDHHVGVWDLETGGTCLAFLAGHARSVHCLTLGHRGGTAHDGASVLFTGSRDHTIRLWVCMHVLTTAPSPLPTGSRDHTIRLWDLRTGCTQHVLEGHTGSVTCLGTDGWRLMSGGG